MTTSIPVVGWGTLDGIWDDSDPVDLALSAASLADGVRDLLELKLGMGNYTTADLLLAASPSAIGYYTATNAPGAFFYWSGSTWTMCGTAKFATAGTRSSAITSPSQGMSSSLTTHPGVVWQYFAAYDPSTNVGGTSSAGWYPVVGSALRCILSRTQTFTTAVEADVSAYTEDSDPWGWHSTSSNTQRVTPTFGGYYKVMLFSAWVSNVTGNRLTRTRKNNADTLTEGAVQSDTPGAGALGTGTESSVTLIKLNGSTDYVNIRGYQNSGGNLDGSFRVVVEYTSPPTGP